MTNVDQFESVFRSASKEPFVFERVTIGSVLIVTDLDAGEAALFAERVRGFLAGLAEPRWELRADTDFSRESELMQIVEGDRPDLICTHRRLQTGKGWPFSLGTHVEVLTQATAVPVMVLPHPQAAEPKTWEAREVMAITDHLTGDHRLVNWAASFVDPGGLLLLTHVEDEALFERTIDVISKIPEIDTDVARELIAEQLLKEPRDYVASCRAGLEEHGLDLTIDEVVVLGHHLREHRDLVERHGVDLLVLNTKEDDQLAMHGLAYPLAVELRRIPLLML
ncbi:MAG: hypothetical protein GY715_10150 [Planctomycetes bacterium]|nr:hypothetical protein [Planctomycetota bacterium]